MAILPILQYPDERLHKVAKKVESITAATRKLVSDMAETMYAAPGIGLAATQIDVHQRIIVIDVSEAHDALLVLINPELIASSGESKCEEGCLSVPGIYDKVERAERCAGGVRWVFHAGQNTLISYGKSRLRISP